MVDDPADERFGELGAGGNRARRCPGVDHRLHPGSRLQASSHQWCQGIRFSTNACNFCCIWRCISTMNFFFFCKIFLSLVKYSTNNPWSVSGICLLLLTLCHQTATSNNSTHNNASCSFAYRHPRRHWRPFYSKRLSSHWQPRRWRDHSVPW